MIIGRTIAGLREQHGFSQVALAHEVGLTQPTLSRVERGGTQPDPFTLRKMALAFKMTLPELLTRVEDAYQRAQKQAKENAPKASRAAASDDSWVPLAAALGALGVASLVGLAVAASMAEQKPPTRPPRSSAPEEKQSP